MTSAASPLHAALLDAWGRRIVGGGYAPGDRISLEDDSIEITASRTVTREATRVLESMGLVTIRRRAGAVVNPPDLWNALDPQIIAWRLQGPGRIAQLHALSELRLAIEPAAARLAALRADAGAMAAMTEAAISMVAHSGHADQADYLEADLRFHRSLLDGSGNALFRSLSSAIEAVLVGRTEHELMPSRADAEALTLHTEVAALIRAGNAAGAERSMRTIIEEADQAVQRQRD